MQLFDKRATFIPIIYNKTTKLFSFAVKIVRPFYLFGCSLSYTIVYVCFPLFHLSKLFAHILAFVSSDAFQSRKKITKMTFYFS